MKLWYYPKDGSYHVAHHVVGDLGCVDVTADLGHRAEAMFEGLVLPPIPDLFAPLPADKFSLILADPPWRFKTHTGGGVPQRADEQHYQTHTFEELRLLDVGSIAEKDCALALWVIGSHLKQAIQLAEEAWGFQYKTDLLTWVKTGKHDPAVRPISMGFWSRKQTELCLLFARGAPKRLDAGVRQLIESDDHIIYAPKREHSRKPDEQYARLDRLLGGSRIELFARRPHAGWAGWGNEYTPADQYDGL